MAILMASAGAEAARYLKTVKAEAIRSFSTRRDAKAYTSPLFLRRLHEVQESDLESVANPTHSHTMLLLPDQTYEKEDECFLSMLCAECRYHFHVQTYKGHSEPLDDSNHLGHMLLPVPEWFVASQQDPVQKTDPSLFVCGAEDCFYMVKLCVMPPKLTSKQISILQDNHRTLANLERARAEEPERYGTFLDSWTAGSAIPTLIKYILDRLQKPPECTLKIKKRNMKFRVAFNNDLDDLLRSLGFEEKTDEEGEECWFIRPTETFPPGQATPVYTRRAHIQDHLEELRTLLPNSTTTPAWEKLVDVFPGYALRREIMEPVTVGGPPSSDSARLGCLNEYSPKWYSWAAILLADLCPSRRDEFLDAGLRCIPPQEGGEDASLNIIMYKSKFDGMPSVNPHLQAAFEFFGASPNDAKDTQLILSKYRTLVEADMSSSFRTQAAEHLETISNHIGVDLLGEIARVDSLEASSVDFERGPMSVATASRLLNVEPNYPAELIRDFAINASEHLDRERIIEALEALCMLKQRESLHSEAKCLREAGAIFRGTPQFTRRRQNKSATPEQPTPGPTGCVTLPPGLINIGNTCYLNSLLQYFYNVKAVREMVLNYDQIELALDDVAIDNRRTGGNGTRVTIEEAIVARQFVQELRRLFSELQVTTGAATPSQKLANTALSSAKEILTEKLQNQPPPLPARPSPAPPTETNGVNVNVEPIYEHQELSSSVSSRTLVNEIDTAFTDACYGSQVEKQINSNAFSSSTESIIEFPSGDGVRLDDNEHSEHTQHIEDLAMEDPELDFPMSLEQKIAEVSRCLEQSDRSGTSQQDVEEIIGNILEHLMRAIRPSGPMNGKPDLQADKVTELFFTTIVNSTVRVKIDSDKGTPDPSVDEHVLNEEVVPERWITAFPHPDKTHQVKNTLYEALDRYFSYELLSDGDLARYTTIRALPPILHICLQRSDASGVKNKNPVIIPEVLYLDRYMEADTGSDLWKTRRRVWAIKERINELEKRACVENVLKSPGQHAPPSPQADRSQAGDDGCEELLDLDSQLWNDVRRRNKRDRDTAELAEPAEAAPAKRRSTSRDNTSNNFADILWETGRRGDEANSAELVSLRREQEAAFQTRNEHRYCLHAMICHAGGMNAGHYWVWIRDFKRKVWYKFNDSVVTQDTRDSQEVIDELNNSGDPYYVAYVRDDLKDDLVEVPQHMSRVSINANDNEDANMDNVSQIEMEVIESIAIDTPPQPANSPVNTAMEVIDEQWQP
ncbi:cysteine proteinase [Xylaria sp. CBS 124048]|nr:cysteine proteinase [Xylaria sp. CBS 124048]